MVRSVSVSPTEEASVQLHPNTALTPRQRRRMCPRIDTGMPLAAAAEEFRVSRPTAHKWSDPLDRRRQPPA